MSTSEVVSIILAFVSATGVVVTIFGWRPKAPRALVRLRYGLLGVCTVAVLACLLLLILRPSINRQLAWVVRQAAEYEMAIYKNPEDFRPENTREYYLATDDGGRQVPRIAEAVARLTRHHWHYGQTSRLYPFRILEIQVDPGKAYVTTSERWYVPLVDNYGQDVVSVNGHPYNPWLPSREGTNTVHYWLVQRDGKWLVRETSDVYAKYY